MDLDMEHTIPVPSPEYLAAARRSIDLIITPRKLSQQNRKFSVKNNFTRETKKQKNPEDFEAEHYQKDLQKCPYVKDPNAPKDKGYFVFITIGLFGLVHMLPFLFFMTANEYWMYKFRNTTSESQDSNDRTNMQKYFSSLYSLTVTTPGVIFNFIGAIGGHKVKAIKRVFFVLFVHSCILIIQAIFVTIDTDTWQFGFLIFTLANQFLMSCAMSLGGSGAMGLISKLPPNYMKAHLMGEGVASVFSSVLRLILILATPSTTGAALMYFVTGSILMIGTSLVFYVATRTNFFRYYTQTCKQDTKERIRNVKDIWEVFKVLWPLIILPLFGMIWPVSTISALVVSEYNGTDSVWANKYFVTVCTYLIPAFAGLFGRAIFNGFDIDFSLPVLYVIAIVKDTFFGSLVFLSNARPRHNLPVIVKHDWEYALLAAGQAMTSNFMMNLLIVKSMRMVPPNRIELSMMITMLFISVFAAATSPLGVLAVSFL